MKKGPPGPASQCQIRKHSTLDARAKGSLHFPLGKLKASLLKPGMVETKKRVEQRGLRVSLKGACLTERRPSTCARQSSGALKGFRLRLRLLKKNGDLERKPQGTEPHGFCRWHLLDLDPGGFWVLLAIDPQSGLSCNFMAEILIWESQLSAISVPVW